MQTQITSVTENISNKKVYLFYTLNPICLTCKEPIEYVKSQESEYPEFSFYYINVDTDENIDMYDIMFVGVFSVPTMVFTNETNYLKKITGKAQNGGYLLNTEIKTNLDILKLKN